MAKVLNPGVWPGTIHVILTLKEYKREFKKYAGRDLKDCDDSLGLAWHTGGTFLIGVFDGTLKTLAHEMGHCAIDLLGHAGAGDWRKEDNQEQFCYLLGWLVSEAAPYVTRGNTK